MDLTDQEARQFLRTLFPQGLRDPGVVAELCPEGWRESPLAACYHPPRETAYREYLESRANLRRLRRLMAKRKAKDGGPESESEEPVPEEPELSFEGYMAKHSGEWEVRAKQMDAIEEPAELLGLCLWDVFSNNHDVIAADGRVANLGSFRGTAGEIADFVDERTSNQDDDDGWSCLREGDYMRFYMGTIWIHRRADLAPVYRLIFRRLKSLGADWRYAFPRLHVISFGENEGKAGLAYDPSTAFAEEAERLEEEKELRRMKMELAKSAKAARLAARAELPPAIVQAYHEVFGRFPDGWPPDPYEEEEDS